MTQVLDRTIQWRSYAAFAGALAALSIACCHAADTVSVNQCFVEYPHASCQGERATTEACRKLAVEYFIDQRKKCYAQSWNIPRAYFLRKPVTYSGATEWLAISVGLPDLVPGSQLPTARRIPLLTEVELKGLWPGNFEAHVRHIQMTHRGVNGLAKTGRTLFGMQVFEPTKKGPDQYWSALLFPEGSAQLFADCILKPGEALEESGTRGGCRVTANLDDRLYLRYYLRKPDMPQVQRINEQLVALVRSFIPT